MVKNRQYSDLTLYRRIAVFLQPYWLHLSAILGLSLLTTPLALLSPLPLKIVVDTYIGGQPLPSALLMLLPAWFVASRGSVLWVVAVFVMVMELLTQLLSNTTSILQKYTTENIGLQFRGQLVRHAQRLSLSYHDSKGTADSIYRIQSDAASLESIALDGIVPFVTAGFTLVVMMFVTFRLDLQLALVALSIAPILFWISLDKRRRLRESWRELKNVESSIQAIIQEGLTAVRVVKAFGQEDREHARFVRQSSDGIRKRLRVTYMYGGYGLVTGVTLAVGNAAVLFVGARHVASGAVSLGELLIIIAYLNRLYGPLRTLGSKTASIQNHLAGAERAFALLDEAPDVTERSDARRLARARGVVKFHKVGFEYEPGHPVLRDVSFDVPAGYIVGIRGRTGAGKTTLVSLLMRFYDPTAGTILLDGVDLRDYKVTDLRNQFAMVLQEPVLFSTSIKDNIAYGRPGASFNDIIAAARVANAHDFIMDLPDGYDAIVGERGMRLSGGERQRVSLARAFLKDAPILILDEPTSSVDIQTETGIMEAMERLMSGRTTFLIAHRLSTLERCHMRLELEDGALASSDVSATPNVNPMISEAHV